MGSDDITVEILKGIREELKQTRTEFRDELRQTREQLSARIDESNARLDRLDRRQNESEIRLATEIVNVAHAVTEVRDLLRDNFRFGEKIDDHERRLRAIEQRRGA